MDLTMICANNFLKVSWMQDNMRAAIALLRTTDAASESPEAWARDAVT